MKVIKIGGSTIQNYNNLLDAIKYVENENNENIIVIISAFDKLSQLLKDLVNNIILNPKNYINELNRLKLFFEKYNNKNTKNLLQKHFLSIENIFYAISILEECSDKLLDNILSFGDIISAEIFYKEISSENVTLLDPNNLIVTDSNYGDANILLNETLLNLKEIEYKKINIIAGFVGNNKNKDITTLGFENSNLTAILFSIANNSKQCQYLTDTDGIYELDPKLIKSNFVENINYQDALNLSRIGLKLFTPKQIELAIKYNIQLSYKSRNSSNKISYVSSDDSTFNFIIIVKKQEIVIYSNQIQKIFLNLANLESKEINKITVNFSDKVINVLLHFLTNDKIIDLIYNKLKE